MVNTDCKLWVTYCVIFSVALFIYYLRQNIQLLSPNIFTARCLNTYIILRISFKHNYYLHKHRICFEPDIELQSASALQ
jgi:hypothetical protein